MYLVTLQVVSCCLITTLIVPKVTKWLITHNQL